MPAPPVRMLVLWCPDWPVTAACTSAGIPVHQPAAVLLANRIVACSAVARAQGVSRGMRRRDAQSRCPEIAVFDQDPDRDARLFEPVAAAVEELVVGVDVVRPGVVAVPVRGAVAYFGGEGRLVERIAEHVSGATGAECQVGIADGLFTAILAAQQHALVEQGKSAEFLAPLSVSVLDQPDADRVDLVDLLRRLGVRTLGAFAELSERHVTSRLGSIGVTAHRLARGLAERPPHRRRLPPDLAVTETIDPPLERVDAAAFLAKALAERFYGGLTQHGLACTRLGIYAGTEHGQELARVWRCAEPLTPGGIADRVRWQFDGWLRAGDATRPTAGVTRLRLEPEETVEGRSLQLGLWPGGSGSEHTPEADKAARALLRVQGLLGAEGVFTAVADGGRGPAEQVRLVPWGEAPEGSTDPQAPWPGRLPSPSPATVLGRDVPAEVVDAAGEPVTLTARRQITAPPHRIKVESDPAQRVVGWAGPWPEAARWWDPAGHGDRARIQVLLEGSVPGQQDTAMLLLWNRSRKPLWTVEGVYD